MCARVNAPTCYGFRFVFVFLYFFFCFLSLFFPPQRSRQKTTGVAGARDDLRSRRRGPVRATPAGASVKRVAVHRWQNEHNARRATMHGRYRGVFVITTVIVTIFFFFCHYYFLLLILLRLPIAFARTSRAQRSQCAHNPSLSSDNRCQNSRRHRIHRNRSGVNRVCGCLGAAAESNDGQPIITGYTTQCAHIILYSRAAVRTHVFFCATTCVPIGRN